MKVQFGIITLALTLAATASISGAAERTLATGSVASASAYGAPKPSKKLSFDDGLVEGMNKRPYDSFNQLSEADKTGKLPHLYKKRANFSDEVADTLKQVRYDNE